MTDTKDRITPVAFAPAPTVMNLPLARPWRRGVAMACDLSVIALLTSMGDVGLGLFLLCLWVVYKSSVFNDFERFGKLGVWLLRGASLLIVVASVWFVTMKINQPTQHEGADDPMGEAGLSEVFEIGALLYQVNKCNEIDCFKSALTQFIDLGLATDNPPSVEDLSELIDEVATDKSLSSQQISELKKWSQIELAQQLTRKESLTDKESLTEQAPVVLLNENDDNQQHEEPKSSQRREPHSFSPLKWLMGLIEDLGLGFGFAAIYFSCFTSWFNGQTFGKMLLNIRVIQLNNSKITLWESFGRYGGYGAGLATGLLGFVQIYWDANRQAIQDKISATVVIDLSLKYKETLDNINEQVQHEAAVERIESENKCQ